MRPDDPADQIASLCAQRSELAQSTIEQARSLLASSRLTTTFLRHLASLASYKIATARRAEQTASAVLTAMESRRQALEEGCASLGDHPLLSQPLGGWSDPHALLRALEEGEGEARSRLRAAERAMPCGRKLLELREWEQARARDQARSDLINLADLRLEGMRAMQRCLERSLCALPTEAAPPPALPEDAPPLPPLAPPHPSSPGPEKTSSPLPFAGAGEAGSASLPSPLLDLKERLASVCGDEAKAQAATIATRIHSEQQEARILMEGELDALSSQLKTCHASLESEKETHSRRSRGEALLLALESLQGQVVGVRKMGRRARLKLDDLQDEGAPGDPEVERARAALSGLQEQEAALSLRRDGVAAEISAICVRKGAAKGREGEGRAGEGDETAKVGAEGAGSRDGAEGAEGVEWGEGAEGSEGGEDDSALPLDFPELPVRAWRIVQPFRAYDALDETSQRRFDVELLLRGLLVCERNYSSFSHLRVIKPNVKQARLRGVARGSNTKILKEYALSEFGRVKRAVATASRLRHPGIVPVECAFLERGEVVVVQSPLYPGGNLREWGHGKPLETLLRTMQRVSEAVRYLHSHGVLHRDIKPENIVLDAEGSEATPALCDFDLSVNAAQTLASTLMRGTLLYLPPDPAPSAASDVWALGVTMLEVLFCDCEQGKLRQMLLPTGAAIAEAADMERVRSELSRRTSDAQLAQLVSSMLAPQPGERPAAEEVAATLSELVNVRTCELCHCPEPLDNGLQCDGAGHHFTCDECLSAHVCRPDALHADGMHVKCPLGGGDGGCAACLPLTAVAQHATPLAFETLLRHADDLKQVAMQGELEAWKRSYQCELAAKSEEERQALAVRKHIEEMMSLRCPKCCAVFSQFEGCAALKCAYANCKAAFCAFCLADCAGDAHSHVRTCRLNPNQGQYHVSEADWSRIIDEQRREKLSAYWSTLNPKVKDNLSNDGSLTQIFRDLNLNGLLDKMVFAEQVAQLRGMGFTDIKAMRLALAEVDGDVPSALEILLL
ncbi:MAG: hypothetical protein SGPRY_010041 [Prymnesium sp.]